LTGNGTTGESCSVTVDTDAEPVVITLHDKDNGIQPVHLTGHQYLILPRLQANPTLCAMAVTEDALGDARALMI
jgi:hypothetical protein